MPQASSPLQIGMLLFPGLTQLDLTGPYEVLTRVPDTQAHLIWKTLEPVRAESGLQLLPSVTLTDCPALDVVCIPGGAGVDALLNDREIVTWVQRTAERARCV